MKHCTGAIPDQVVAQRGETSHDIRANMSIVPSNNAGFHARPTLFVTIVNPDTTADVRSIAIHCTIEEHDLDGACKAIKWIGIRDTDAAPALGRRIARDGAVAQREP